MTQHISEKEIRCQNICPKFHSFSVSYFVFFQHLCSLCNLFVMVSSKKFCGGIKVGIQSYSKAFLYNYAIFSEFPVNVLGCVCVCFLNALFPLIAGQVAGKSDEK